MVMSTTFRNPQLYAGKLILAPMVRVGSLPMRLLALNSGADLVYSPEIVDKSIIGASRHVNGALGTVDYIKDGRLIFRTHPFERERLVFQIGSADPDLALKAALTVQDDVAAFDLNCGCPKKFSVHAGMGAALLKSPDRLVEILEKLLVGTERPVSAKIRLFLPNSNSDEEGDLDGSLAETGFTLMHTKHLVRRIIRTGVSALAIHARDPVERSDKHPAHWDLFRKLASCVAEMNSFCYGAENPDLHTTLILNGDVGLKDSCSYEPEWPLSRLLQESGAKSVMSARAVQWNPLAFHLIRKSCKFPLYDGCLFGPILPSALDADLFKSLKSRMDCLVSASKCFLLLAHCTGNHFSNSKFVLMQIWNNAATNASISDRKWTRDLATRVQRSGSGEELAQIFNVSWNSLQNEIMYEEYGE